MCLYERRSGDLFVRICARVRLFSLDRDSSDLFIVGGFSLRILFRGMSAMYFCTIEVWMVLRFCLMFSDVTVAGSVCMMCVYELFVWKIVALISLLGFSCCINLCSGCDGFCDFCLI